MHIFKAKGEPEMNTKMTDITLHIDENINKAEREALRDAILIMDGVMTADCQDNTPHLMIIGYDPDLVNSMDFLSAMKVKGMHAELVGL